MLSYKLSTASNSDVTQNYIKGYAPIAIQEMQRVGIPASIKMAQAILESNSGRSTLARQSNNHFGIKCGKNWTGGEVYREDDDYENGLLIRSCFRAYDDPAESFYAHSDFLANPYSKRYKFLFDLDPYDYKSWARGLKKAGYATDPNYPTKLINIIESYRLYDLDLGLMPDGAQQELIVQNDQVKASSSEPIAVNDMGNAAVNATVSDRKTSGTAIRNSAPVLDKEGRYIVKAGENMMAIAERYNISPKKLYVQNRIPFGAEPMAGESLKLDGYIHFGKRPDYTKQKSSQQAKHVWKEKISITVSL